MNFPTELKYTKDHEWVRFESDFAYVGITDFAQKELGDIVFVELETEWQSLDNEALFGTIEAVKTVSDLFMPVAGEVVEVNPELENNPQFVNEDPYGKGWMIKIKTSAVSDHLMNADDYTQLVGASIRTKKLYESSVVKVKYDFFVLMFLFIFNPWFNFYAIIK